MPVSLGMALLSCLIGLQILCPAAAHGASLNELRAAMLPHASYLVDTGECADCHSTHTPTRSDVLVAGSGRLTDSCTYCHAGGGGSSHVIALDTEGSLTNPVTGEESPWGVGHSLGSRQRAPDDVKPAYMSDSGMDCFSCHTPHVDSPRVMTTFYSPRVSPAVSKITALVSSDGEHAEVDDAGLDIASVTGNRGDWWGVAYSLGVLVVVQDGRATPTAFYPSGRFLLLSDPHPTSTEGRSDASVAAVPGSAGHQGSNKVAVQWHESGVWDPLDLLTPNRPDVLSLDAVCVDCHDGAAGTSVSRAVVWQPGDGGTDPGYKLVYEHDCRVVPDTRAMRITSTGLPDSISTAGRDNYGPQCSVCHSGGSACDDCHTSDSAYQPQAGAWDRIDIPSGWMATQLAAGESVVPSVTLADVACIDSGMNWPHRTLGVAMLKNSLYGVDFDGTCPKDCGETRETATEAPVSSKASFVGRFVSTDERSVEAAISLKMSEPEVRLIVRPTESLDSVCIDCHGDASYWAGKGSVEDRTKGFRVHEKGLP